jgi:hypothetical protein
MDGQKFFLRTSRTITLSSALLIGVVLIVAAIGKIFFPIESLKTFERVVGIFEILFFLTIFFYRNKWQAWLTAIVIFGAWGGYALFWANVKLPCNCMGTMLPVPTCLSLVLDLFFYLGSLGLGVILGAKKRNVYLSVICSLFAALVGFALADFLSAQLYQSQ